MNEMAQYTIRPDGHIGLAGTRLEASAVKNWLAEAHVRTEDAARPEPVLQARAG